MGRGEPIPSLRKWRSAAALTQAELAAKAGLSRNTVARLEADRTKPADMPTVSALAKALNVRPVDLMAAE